MAASEATRGYGTLLQLSIGGTYTTVAEITSINGVGVVREFTDVTHMESPDAYHEFIATLKQSNDISLEANFLPANATQQALLGVSAATWMADDTKQLFKIIFTDTATTTASFSGWAQNFSIGAPVDGKTAASFTIKVTGPITLS